MTGASGPGPLGRRPGAGALAVLVVLAVVAGLVAAAVLPVPGGGPQVRRAAFAGLAGSLPPVPSPLLTALDGSAQLPTPDGTTAALRDALAAPALGGTVAALVVDALTGTPLLSTGAGSLVTPASTTKLVTALAAVTTLAPSTRLATRVVTGSTPGEIVLVGGGDPTLTAAPDRAGSVVPDPGAPARLTDLAAALVAARGPAAPPVDTVVVDASLWEGPALGPGWSPGYVSGGDVAPVSALSVDGGRSRPDRRARVDDPARAAGTALADLLRSAGAAAPSVQVRAGRAAAGAGVLARVESPPVADLVEQMLQSSDNDLAEALARAVAIAAGQPPTFAGAATAVQSAAVAAGVPAAGLGLVDGSGLSRDDRLSPEAVVAVLRLAADPSRPDLRPVVTGLPVAGFSGTLGDRFRSSAPPGDVPAAGRVRAKTGTLSGVSALAGLVVDVDGRLLAFALYAGSVPGGGTRQAQRALDAVASALAGCGCR